MKKLLLPLIILLLIIGYFMSRGGDHEAKDAYDSLDKPKSESMDQDMGTKPDETPTPPDGMGTPDTGTEQPDAVPPGETDSSMMDKAEDAASDVGEAVKDTAEDAGKAVGEAAEKTGDALKKAGEETKEAAEDVMDKMRGEDTDKTTEEPKEEPQN